MIAYTIGNTLSYDKALSEHSCVEKLSGGWVWITVDEAQRFLDKNQIFINGIKKDNSIFSIYELNLNCWNIDVSINKDDYGIYTLINDVVILKKIIR